MAEKPVKGSEIIGAKFPGKTPLRIVFFSSRTSPTITCLSCRTGVPPQHGTVIPLWPQNPIPKEVIKLLRASVSHYYSIPPEI